MSEGTLLALHRAEIARLEAKVSALRERIGDYRRAMENGTPAACAKTYDALIVAAGLEQPARPESEQP